MTLADRSLIGTALEIGNVIGEGSGEQKVVLQYGADPTAPFGEVTGHKRHAVDQDTNRARRQQGE